MINVHNSNVWFIFHFKYKENVGNRFEYSSPHNNHYFFGEIYSGNWWLWDSFPE